MKSRTVLGAGLAVVAGLFTFVSLHATDQRDDQQNNSWYQSGQETLNYRLTLTPKTGKAKNVIVFIADGLGVTAATASRYYDGQAKGLEGGENFLAWERFPYTALIKTYSTDAQIPDSAATASAIATGIKTHNGAISAPDWVTEDNCAPSEGRNFPQTLAEKASALGKATGVITTTIISDATPAALYAHSPNRRWWNLAEIPEQAQAQGCKDIVLQLMESDIDVALGGGRTSFVPEEIKDPEQKETGGVRPDGRNLIGEWLKQRPAPAYVKSREELLNLDTRHVESLLGLFAPGSLLFEEDVAGDGMTNPSLSEMTGIAIDILSKDQDGFFLLIEHEGTDDLQHQGFARKTFEAAREISQAVETALAKSDLSETLIVVTSDHGQAMVFSGSAPRGNPILGLARDTNGELALANDGKPYTPVGFYSGPAAVEGEREDLTNVDTTSPDFIPQSLLPGYVSHSGEDVALYAAGPWAHLFGGLIEQSAIFHLIAYAMDPEVK